MPTRGPRASSPLANCFLENVCHSQPKPPSAVQPVFWLCTGATTTAEVSNGCCSLLVGTRLHRAQQRCLRTTPGNQRLTQVKGGSLARTAYRLLSLLTEHATDGVRRGNPGCSSSSTTPAPRSRRRSGQGPEITKQAVYISALLCRYSNAISPLEAQDMREHRRCA